MFTTALCAGRSARVCSTAARLQILVNRVYMDASRRRSLAVSSSDNIFSGNSLFAGKAKRSFQGFQLEPLSMVRVRTFAANEHAIARVSPRNLCERCCHDDIVGLCRA